MCLVHFSITSAFGSALHVAAPQYTWVSVASLVTLSVLPSSNASWCHKSYHMIELFHLRRLSAGHVGRRSTLVSCGFQNSSLPWSPNPPGQPFSAPLTCSLPPSKVPALALVSPWFSGCFSLMHQPAQTASTLPSGSWHHFQECVQLLQTLCG